MIWSQFYAYTNASRILIFLKIFTANMYLLNMSDYIRKLFEKIITFI